MFLWIAFAAPPTYAGWGGRMGIYSASKFRQAAAEVLQGLQLGRGPGPQLQGLQLGNRLASRNGGNVALTFNGVLELSLIAQTSRAYTFLK